MKIGTPLLGGVVGAAQLSTACFVFRPSSGTDFLLSAVVGWDLLWSVPPGSFLGAALGWMFLRLPRYPNVWRQWWATFGRAMVLGFVVAPFAPAMLGLSPTPAQLQQGFASLYSVVWLCLIARAQFERRPFV